MFKKTFSNTRDIQANTITNYINMMLMFKVILCASEHICSIVRYCCRSFKQL